MSEDDLTDYLAPQVSGSYKVVEIDIEQEPVYAEIPSEPGPAPPQRPRYKRAKSESLFHHEELPLVNMRIRNHSGGSKSREKRRSEPGNGWESKDHLYKHNPSRKSWHQESETRQLRVFEEITGTEGRRSRILYELESRNGMTRSRISLVENVEKRKVLAEQLSMDSLGSDDGRNSLPLPQRRKTTTIVDFMTNTPRRTKVFMMEGAVTLILLMVGGIVAYISSGENRDMLDGDMTTSDNSTFNHPVDGYYDTK